jgi:hypothetical protein
LEPLTLIEGAGEVRTSGTVISQGFARVHALRVQVLFDGPIGASSYETEDGVHEQASEASWGALDVAKRVVSELVEWLRVSPGQSWLGLSGEEQWPSGRSRLEDLEAGLRLPYSFSGRRIVNPADRRRADR